MVNSSFAFLELSGNFSSEYFQSVVGWIWACGTYGYGGPTVLTSTLYSARSNEIFNKLGIN